MNKLTGAGIWDIFKQGNLSFLHLHNHKHTTETRPMERPVGGVPRWPDDPLEFCTELERQATQMVTRRMQEGSAYLMTCLGKYSHYWFEKCHNGGAGIFRVSLGYDYDLETIYIPVTDQPARHLEYKLFRPRNSAKRGTIAAVLVNAPAFTAHDIDAYNDCIGKALRLVRQFLQIVTVFVA
jgi:hypothetical protein